MVHYLVFRDTLFAEAEQSDLKEDDLAVLAINGTTSTLYFHEAIPIIEKLTAQRQANSIAKSGFLLSNNMRIGSKTNLKVVVGKIPTTSSQSTVSKTVETQNVSVPVVESEHDEPKQVEDEITPETLNKTMGKITETIESQPQTVTSEQTAETYDRPIRFTVDKNESENDQESTDNPIIEENIPVPELKGETDSDNKLSIQEILNEEKEKVLTEEAKSQPEKPARTYDEVIEYFWLELFGQVYSSWDSLPAKAKTEFFQTLDIKELSDQEVQELFAIRHENNIEAFKHKLASFTERNRA